MLEIVTYEMFADCINTPFHIAYTPPVTIILVEAQELRFSPPYEAFSIVFCGPGDTFLPQANYHVHHDVIGTFDLFIAPIGQDQRGFYYEACFNRLRADNHV